MSVDVTTEIVIRRPLADVAAYAANPDHVRDWYENIKAVEWKTPPPVGLGSRVAFIAHFLGRRLEYTYEVVELTPNSHLVMRTSEGPFPMETSYRWRPVSDHETHMALRNRGIPSGFSRWLTPVMTWAMRRAMARDLRQLKALLEAESGRL